MDEAFVRMSENYQVSYNKSFWEDARINLENESLDAAFRAAADTGFVLPAMMTLEGLDDVFMDDAFRDAALESSANYSTTFWSDFQNMENELQMDEAFQEAAQSVEVNYSPLFWSDANDELVKEGLHYEYTPAYWNEARVLLDQSDRRIFFARWSAVAILLLLISFVGIGYQPNQAFVQKSAHNKVNQLDNRNDARPNLGSSVNNSLQDVSQSTRSFGSNVQINPRLNNVDEARTNSELVETHVSSDGFSGLNNQRENAGLNENLNQPENFNGSIVPDFIQEPEDLFQSHGLNNFALSSIDQHEFKRSSELGFVELFPVNLREIPLGKIDVTPLPSPFVLIEPKVIDKPHAISLIGGAGLGKSYGSTELLLTKRIYGGLGYSYKGSGNLKKFDWGVKVTLNYNSFDELEAENQSVNYKVDGTYSRSWSHVQIRESYYINPSIYSSYHINRRNSVRLGVGMEQLMGVKSNMAYKLNDDLGIKTVNNNWGVKNGMKRQDFQLSLGYEFKVKDYLGLQLSMNCGMFDRTDDTFFRQLNVKDRETSLTVGLNYTILRK